MKNEVFDAFINFVSSNFPIDGKPMNDTISWLRHQWEIGDTAALKSYLSDADLSLQVTLPPKEVAFLSDEQLAMYRLTCQKVVAYQNGCEQFCQKLNL